MLLKICPFFKSSPPLFSPPFFYSPDTKKKHNALALHAMINTTATLSAELQSEARLTIRVAVGSSNPCKIEAVRIAFGEIFSTATKQNSQIVLSISSYNVPSGKRVCGPVVVK